ncbi:MAG: MATE family efflux transporter [Methanosarcinaceae archaeon]|nr:MATE family efflux transporter [Methanosarcinaceae archaeon]
MKENNLETEKTQEREQLLSWSMGRLFKKLAIPGMIGMVLIGLCNLMDAVFVGHLIGKEAIGAVAIVSSVALLNLGICLLIGSGSMSMLSIAIGKKDQKTIDKLLGNMIVSILILSGIFSIIVYLNTEWIVSFIGGEGLVAELATEYLRVISIGMVFSALGPAMNFLIRGEGKIKTAMYFASGVSILNIILNPIFISVLGMGIEGAAVATVISHIVYVLLNLLFFSKGNGVIVLQRMKLRLEKDILPSIFKVGSAQLIMMVMATIQQVILFRSLQYHGGSEHVILMGASYRAFMFAYIAIWGIAQGLQPVIGMNYGAGKINRVKKAFNTFTLLGLILTSIIWVIFMVFPDLILGIFIIDSDIIIIGVPLFRILTSIFFAYIYFANLSNLFIGLGRGKEPGIFSILRQIVFFIPLVFVLPMIFGTVGVWIALPLADFFTMIVAAMYHRKILISEEFANS